MKSLTCRVTETSQQRSMLLFFAFTVSLVLSGNNALAGIAEIVDKRLVPPLVPSITKIYNGSECQFIDLENINSPEYYNNPVRYYPEGIRNEEDNGGATHVVCPIVRDITFGNTHMTDGTLTLTATVFVNNNNMSFPVWCELYSMDKYGNRMEVDRDETIVSGGNQALILRITTSTYSGNYSLYCRLPDGDRVYSYRVKEFLY